MLTVVIINTIVCIVGTVAGVVVASGSIISIANMKVPWVAWLLVAAILIPVMFAISGIGAWVAHWWDSPNLILALVALPWVYSLLFVIAMLVTFKKIEHYH